MKCIRALEIQE